MCFLSRTKWLVGLLVFLPVVFAQAEGTFRICAEPDNLPMSQEATHSGYEIEVAELLAKDLGQKLEVQWIPQRDHSYFRQTIGAGACDAIMGVPSDFGRLLTTAPWYRTGFVFVSNEKNKSVTSLDASRLRKLKIGVPVTGLGETPPVVVLTRRSLGKNLRPYSIYEPKKMIEAVATKDIDIAVVWGPFGGWYAPKQKLAIQQIQDRDGPLPLSFDISIGVKKGNETLKEKLNQALQRQHGNIIAILEKWHVPLRKQ